MNEKILLSGARHFMAKEIAVELGKIYGRERLLLADNKDETGMLTLDILKAAPLITAIRQHDITSITHVAPFLPEGTHWQAMELWENNMQGILALLQHIGAAKVKKFIWLERKAHALTVQEIVQTTAKLWARWYKIRFGVELDFYYYSDQTNDEVIRNVCRKITGAPGCVASN